MPATVIFIFVPCIGNCPISEPSFMLSPPPGMTLTYTCSFIHSFIPTLSRSSSGHWEQVITRLSACPKEHTAFWGPSFASQPLTTQPRPMPSATSPRMPFGIPPQLTLHLCLSYLPCRDSGGGHLGQRLPGLLCQSLLPLNKVWVNRNRLAFVHKCKNVAGSFYRSGLSNR